MRLAAHCMGGFKDLIPAKKQGECKNGIEQRLFGFYYRTALRAG